MKNDVLYKPNISYADIKVQMPSYRLFSSWDVRCSSGYNYDNRESTITSEFDNMYSLIRVISGEAVIVTKNKKFTLKQNDILCVRYLDIETYSTDSNIWHYVWYNFFVDNDFIPIGTNNKVFNLPFTETDDEIYNKINYLLGLYSPMATIKANFIFSIYCIDLTELLQQNFQIKKNYSAQMNDAKQYININLSKTINFSQLASQYGFSERYFRKLFNDATGMSPKEYQLFIRMKSACTRINERDSSISQISSSLGFESQFYFSRAFKKIYGISPLQYRNKKS